MEWEDSVLVDTCLPFGLSSAPKIFSAVADAISWALYSLEVENFLHYLDDFLFVGLPASEQCLITLHTAIETWTKLGFPVAPLKVSGPVTALTFLGIELDTVAWELRLPEEKLVWLQQLIASWLGRSKTTKQELQSLIGHLSHATTVVHPGRTFLQYLIEASKRPKRQHQHTCLDAECRSDLAWWAMFLPTWNGISMITPITIHQ